MKQATARAAANWRRLYAMPVASVYPSYIAKAEKKGRTRAEVDEIFRWLTGHSQASLEAEFAKKTSFEDFFAHAPKMNPSRFLITGVVCGVRVEEIRGADDARDPLPRQTHRRTRQGQGDGKDPPQIAARRTGLGSFVVYVRHHLGGWHVGTLAATAARRRDFRNGSLDGFSKGCGLVDVRFAPKAPKPGWKHCVCPDACDSS